MTELDFFTIQNLTPGRVLDGHVHDVLGVSEPVWPYATHPNARARMREWLKSRASVWLAGEAHAGDDCIIEVRGRRRQSFMAGSENHALCLAILLTVHMQRNPDPPIGGSNRCASALL